MQSPIPFPTEAMNPWAWVAFLSVCALAWISVRYIGGLEKRIGKFEAREDKLLTDESSKLTTIRGATDVAMRAADLTDKAFNAANQGLDTTRRNGEKLDALVANIAQIKENQREIERRFESVERALSNLSDERDPPSRRRS